MNMLNVILLENENILFFESDSIYDYQIMSECVETIEFAKKHKPLIILEKIQITESLQVDDRVKYYMKFYGINHVRGGSYATISKEQYEEIRKEFCNLDALELFNSLKYFTHENNNYAIDRNTIVSIQWLMDSVYMKYNMDNYNKAYPHMIHVPMGLFFNDHGVQKYNHLMVELNAIYKKNISRKLDCEYSNYVENPSILFDRLLFSNTEMIYEEIHIAKSVCDYFEYLTYCIINKCDEMEFEINHYNVPDNEMLDE